MGGFTEDVRDQVTRVPRREQELARRGVAWKSGSWLWGPSAVEPGGARQHLPLGSECPVVPGGHWHTQSLEGS